MREYERPPEDERYLTAATYPALELAELVEALANSGLSPGSRTLVMALVREGAIAEFPAGLGIDYASLLKTAVRPDEIALHIQEGARHLRDRQVDLLFAPGMSGYPVGAAYSITSGIPALLLKKTAFSNLDHYPTGSFVVPSYTGEGEFVMSADPLAVQTVVDRIATRKLANQQSNDMRHLHIRLAGADDIIDKGTMSVAVGESAVEIVELALGRFMETRRLDQPGLAPVSSEVEMVAWVTPLMKAYNHPQRLLMDRFGIEPFAGVVIDGISRSPDCLTIAGLGSVRLERSGQ